VSELRAAPASPGATPAPPAAECQPPPAPLDDARQLKLALDDCGSVAELSRRSGQPVAHMRAVLAAEGLVGPKQRRGFLNEDQLGRAARDYEAGANLSELSRRYGVSRTYLRVHLTRAGVQLRPWSVTGGGRTERRGQPAVTAAAQ